MTALLVVTWGTFLAHDEHRTDEASEVTTTDPQDASGASPTDSDAAGATTPGPGPSTTPTPTATSVVAGVRCIGPGDARSVALARAVQQNVAEAVEQRPHRVSVAVRDHLSTVACDYRGDEQYSSASIIKVATAAALIWQAGQEGETPTADQWERVREAIVISDNAAQSTLWSWVGGVEGMTSFLQSAGLEHTEPDPRWGSTQTTARDQVRLVELIAHGDLLPADGRDRLLGYMRQVDASQAWGVASTARPAQTVALKNGWYPMSDGWSVHSIGEVSGRGTDHAIAVLTSRHETLEVGITTVETIADAVGRSFTAAS